MDTSKTSSIKSLLLRAWRERWTDVQWGINIKSVLPRGVSGDVYDLADCILQQALVGPGPNNLFLSYLTHSLSSHVVSYGAVMSSIGRYQSFYKPYCILSLLNLLKSIEKRVGCRGNEEECIALCKAVVNVTHWLYSCVFHSLSKMTELKIQSSSNEHSTIMEKACEILSFFNTSALVKSLLYTGRFEEPNVFNQLLQKHQELESRINQTQGGVCKELFEAALSLVESVNDFPYKALAKRTTVTADTTQPPFACSVNVLIAIDAILNPSGSIQVCVDQLLLVKRLQNLSTPSLYCEILRASFMGLMESSSSSEDLKWAAFAFLKIPQLLVKLRQSLNTAPNESGNDLELGLQKLLYYTPLLDLTDMKSNCDCLQYLLNEFIKAQLLNETQMQDLLSQRQNETHRHTVSRTEQQTNQTSANLILRAEPTVTSILKTLDSDYSKNQDALLGVLCHMIPGKSFELILSAANATGKLHNFANKLIRFNEYNKQMTGEGGRASQTRALLFDITFLMLCHIAQHYGIETVTSSAETRESFFATWVTECLAEGGKYKSPDTMVAHSDAAKVDLLLAQFTNPEPEFKTSLVKWHEICINAPLAIKEILLAWEYGAVSTDRVKMILDNVKSRMCCLPVCISAWLCNYINMLHHEERLKPMNMIQQFMTPLAGECTIWENLSERSTASTTASTEPLNCYYKERSTLMSSIIKKMLYDLHPPPQAMVKNMGFTTISHGLTVKTPLWDIMDNIFTTGHTQGWIDLATTHSLDTLLCVGGSVWFCDTLVRMALKFEHLEDLHRAIDFVFGIFHIDIEQCALAMLTNVIPSYLNKETKQEMLLEPRGTALARLLVMTIFGALQAKQTATSLGVPRTGRKRTNRDVEMEDVNDPERNRPNKIRRGAVGDIELYDDTPFGIQSSNDESLRSLASEPLNRAIADIMRMLMFIALDPTMSQRTLFPVLFLEQITLCAKEQSQMVLQFMPLGLVLQLIKCLPDAFSYELILATSNFQTPRARKITARALCQLDNHQRFFAN